MPWKVERDTTACPVSRPYAVKTVDTGRVHGCHATQAQARAQQSALYANVKEMSVREGSYTTVANGKEITVLYTDAELVKDMANLFSAVQMEDKGDDHVAAKVLKGAMANLQSGKPLSDIELQLFHQLKTKYGSQMEAIANDPTEGFVPGEPEGSGRVMESMATLLPGELARIREQYATASTTKRDKDITAPHLHDGTMHDMAHAMQHAKRLQDKDVLADPQSVQFNVEHVLNHLESGLDHGSRLGKHLEEHPSNPKTWKDEKGELHKMRESDPPPPPNLREAPPHDEATALLRTNPIHECCSCSMYVVESCRCWGYGNYKVDPDWLCDSWQMAPHWTDQLRLKRKLAGEDPETGQKLMSESDTLAQMVELGSLVDWARMREDGKSQICVDFDGVIYDRSHEPGGSDVLGKPVSGAKEALIELAQYFRVVVLTARPNLQAVRVWLEEHDMSSYVSDVTNHKPPAAAYIDNRSYLFKNWPQTVKDILKGHGSQYSSDIPGGTT